MTDIDHLLALDTTDPSAALELRRGVAELVGWRFEPYAEGNYLVYTPEGVRLSYPQLFPERALPHYEMSCDAALTLPLRLADYRLSRVGNGYNFTIYDSPTNEKCVGYGDTAALAICRAFLRYKQSCDRA